LKKKKGKRLYAVVSLVTSVLTIFGGITGAITWWYSMIDRAEYERAVAASHRRTDQWERETLLSSIKYAQGILPTCDFPANKEDRINIELQRSMNILELNNDIETSRSIYENLTNDLLPCPGPLREPSMLPQQDTIEAPSTVNLEILVPILSIPAVVSVIFGIKWYRSRKEVDVSDTSTTTKN
jgi:hypothetical protein